MPCTSSILAHRAWLETPPSGFDLLAPGFPADRELRQVASLDASPDAGIVHFKHNKPTKLLESSLVVIGPEPEVPALLVVERRFADAADAHPLVHVALLAVVEHVIVGRLLQFVVGDDVVLLGEDDFVADL